MIKQGLCAEDAYRQFWLVDWQGLLTTQDTDLTDAQRPYAREGTSTNLLSLIRAIKPTALIGCSAQAGAFSRELVEVMCEFNTHPIIFPLSNPLIFNSKLFILHSQLSIHSGTSFCLIFKLYC
jgi:malate dehydrogenase (oxaloacetate-decarboxylating)